MRFLRKGLTSARVRFEVADAIAAEKDSGETTRQTEALAALSRFTRTIEKQYVVNPGFLRWSESVCGWD